MRVSRMLMLLVAALLLALAGVQAQVLVSYPTSLKLEGELDLTHISPAQVSGVLLSGSDLPNVAFTIHAQNADGAQMPFHQSIQCDEDGEADTNVFGDEDFIIVDNEIDDGPPACVVFGTDFSEAAAYDSQIYVALSGPTTGLLMVIAPTSQWAAEQDDMVFSEEFEIIADGCTSASGAPAPQGCKPLTKKGPKQLGRWTNSRGVLKFTGAVSVIIIRRNTPCGARFDFTIALQHKIDCLQAPGCEWSECSVTCGAGVQTRTLYTVRPALNGGKECLFPAIETQTCTKPDCDVDCDMGEWSPWSTCSATCGGGTQTSTRIIECAPQGKGKPCEETTRKRACGTDPCPVDCKLGAWTPFCECDAKCGGGVKTRTRPIITQPANGGDECDPTEETEECNTQPCPVDCKQTEWGPWSSCSASCGAGTRTRSRATLIYPEFGGKECGECTETEACKDCDCPVNCEVSGWSDWTPCSKSCGGGKTKRTRTITRQPANGGAQCPPLVEEDDCNEEECPTNCEMGQWGPWSTCSASCGGGVETRTRVIKTPACNGGAECGPTQETRPCGTNKCPIDCVLSDWCEFGQCSKTCGGGTQTRTRTVITQPQYGGKACLPLTDTAPCNTDPCPQDCELGPWCPWSDCSKKCDGGLRTRSREIVKPPKNGGKPCDILTQSEHCNTQCCDVDCEVSGWSEWSSCNKPCDGGVRTRKRTITKQPSGNGKQCPALQEAEACNTKKCAVDCVMGEYGPWSTCSATCGGGMQSRHRVVKVPSSNGGDECPCTEEWQPCNTQGCPVDCKVSEWSSCSSCSASCGGGTQTRTRVVLVQPKNNGASCPPLEDIDECNTQECPIDCVMNDWSEWSVCSHPCGAGVQERTRTVRTPPKYGGKQCPTNLREQRTCPNLDPCPVDCKMSPWIETTCSKTCGGGTITRTRGILQEPAYGGVLCGPTEEHVPCNTNPCPQNCVVSDWCEYGQCSATCGGGVQESTRSIIVHPAYGGTPCPELKRTRACNTQGCPIDCKQGEWGPWSDCSATCGSGVSQRTRQIITEPSNGGKPCDSCVDFKTCNTQKCTRDCEVSEWKDWGSCSKKCGGGVRIRYRTITKFPGWGGKMCPALIDLEKCNTQECDNDCEMGDWGNWGQCSKKCGGGTQKRMRSVERPKCGKGKDCPPEWEERPCNTQECDEDCKMGDWSGWSKCSKSCGGGTQTRTRNQERKRCGGGATCPPESETRACNTRACAVDCVMGPYGAWSSCSKECGGGVMSQTREVITPASNGGKKCPCLINQKKCNTQKCPKKEVNCKVSQWGSWSKCSKDCGGGVSTRTRTVTTWPSNGGKECPALKDTKICNPQPCKTDCKVSDWSNWGSCSKTCGGGVKTRTRKIVSKSCGGGKDCPPLVDTEPCNTQSCKQDCEVSSWSSWTKCSKDCGGGEQKRTRTVTKPASGGGKSCPALTETKNCNTQQCKDDCKVSDWSSWGKCTKTCGGGTQTRTRKVISKSCGGGKDCPPLTDTQSCNTEPCKQDCEVSGWGAWSTCSKTCGGGVSTRVRVVTKPATNGGKACPNLSEQKDCNKDKCKEDCEVSDWCEWSPCTKSCGGGTQERTRRVIRACNGGKDCPNLKETRTCNTQSCKQDCEVSGWSNWGQCSATCGGGVQQRTRTVTKPAQNGGKQCPALTDTQTCNTQTCKSDCKVSDWGSWSTCSKTCGGGIRTHTRTVINKPCDGGASCPPLSESEPCNTQPCVIDCKVSGWSAWSTCSKTCGGGTQKRTRTVTTWPCSNGAQCPALTETQNCNTQACSTDCKVSDWSSWSACTKGCGGGTTTRTRTVTTQPCNGGASCPPLSETGSCNTQPCKEDCKVSDWSNWGSCSKTCGGGTQTRTRKILSVACGGGKDCPPLTDSQPCNTQNCPESCSWDYSDWSDCSNSCGAGTKTRTGKCKTASGASCDASKCGSSTLVTSCSGTSCGMGCVATSCGGDGSQSLVSFAQGSAGTLTVTVKYTQPAFGDIRGFFLEFSPSSRLAGKGSACTLSGKDITSFERNTRQLSSDSNVNLNGCSGPSSYDLAVVFGTNGLSRDDVRSTSFTLVCKGYTLTVADVDDARVGVRAQSVGSTANNRNQSSKQICVVSNKSGFGRRL